MELFKLAVKEKRLHPLFKRIISSEVYKPTIDVINSWSRGLVDRKKESKKFVQDFQISFNSSLWELYLNKAFIDLGFNIDYSKESPDFNLLHRTGRVVNVEAVTSNNKENLSSEYYSEESIQSAIAMDNEEFLDQSTIKLAGKIKDKKDLFVGINNKKYPYKDLEHVKGNPFVIAVAPFDNHLSYSQNNMAINRVLYGINPPPPSGDGESIGHILNHNGQKIELGIFTNPSYKEVSAVIFSTTGMFGKAVVQAGIQNYIRATRYRQMGVVEFMTKEGLEMLGRSHKTIKPGCDVFSIRFFDGNLVCGSDTYLYQSSEHVESHLDGLHVYYNPYASVPLDKDLFLAYEITQNSYDVQEQQMVCEHNDGSLVSRQTFTSLA
ncbi:hypothetical protein KFJ24_02545 [Marinobacter sediminum]|uniref:hypothetical protein n=1 Tax=Marinobacter sediminum TaxID=256323 RepID=UPI002030F4B1|nr:hypothetical protein [Marinobacter sediminum]MCM0611353.1 hypothetical protein [Marinobacter sediminum]